MTNPLACKHCGKPVWQPEKHGEWYHDDSAGTLRCCEGKQVANPVASQQPAPIPEDLKELYGIAKRFHEIRMEPSILRDLIERIARLEAALRALRTYMWAEGYADQAEAMRQADAALGTPGKGEK